MLDGPAGSSSSQPRSPDPSLSALQPCPHPLSPAALPPSSQPCSPAPALSAPQPCPALSALQPCPRTLSPAALPPSSQPRSPDPSLSALPPRAPSAADLASCADVYSTKAKPRWLPSNLRGTRQLLRWPKGLNRPCRQEGRAAGSQGWASDRQAGGVGSRGGQAGRQAGRRGRQQAGRQAGRHGVWSRAQGSGLRS